MSSKFFSRISRWMAALTLAAILAALIPGTSYAATVPSISFSKIKAGESVTVHGINFPKNTVFTVRMDKMGNYAINGTVVGTINSGSGSFDATFNIPTSLKIETLIALRLDSTNGWYCYNWFTNKTVSEPAPPSPTGKPYIEIIGVKANESVTVQAYRFPANETFNIRIGSYKNFFKDFVVVDSIYSGSGGSYPFTVKLPDVVKGVDLVTIRLDSPSKQYAFNVFKNVNAGNVQPNPTPLPGKGTCEILSASPSKSLSKWEDFDAVWSVKNTSTKTWEMNSVDYKYVSGKKIHKHYDIYDFSQTVKPGEIVKIVVDMLAPGTAGTVTENWAIVEGKTTLCSLSLTVNIK